MELTRRDALAALASVGAVGSGVAAGRALDAGAPRAAASADEHEAFDDADAADVLGVLVAASEVLYPSAVEGHERFVETYVLGRIEGRPAYRRGLVEAVSALDGVARDWHAASFADLAVETRDSLLREVGADVAAADPEGSVSARVRFYVVDELLYALYTSPTGGELVGIENPTGHPGGTTSYRRGPPGTEDDDGDE